MLDLWAHQKARELERELAIRRAQRLAPAMASLQASNPRRGGHVTAKMLEAAFRLLARRVRILRPVLRRKRATGS